MGWSIGYDTKWSRDIGYGVPATCDHPGCGAEIDRGLGYVCGQDVYGGDHGCGLFFCDAHLTFAESHGDRVCERCATEDEDVEWFDPTPDVPEWTAHKLTDESWQQWRDANPAEVAALKAAGNANASAVGVSGPSPEMDQAS